MAQNEVVVLLIEKLGGKENLLSIQNCMTRLRIVARDKAKIDSAAIKAVDGVLGVVETDDGIQILVGPGKSARYAREMSDITGVRSVDVPDGDQAAQLKAANKAKNDTPFKRTMKKIANIFIPIIPAFVGCGLMLAIYELCHIVALDFFNSAAGTILGIVAASVFDILKIVVGYNAAKEFGGSGVLGACLAAILGAGALDGLNLFGIVCVPGRGGVIAVLLVAIFAAMLEKKVRAVMPDALDTFVSPLVVLFVMTFAGLIVIQPIAGGISTGIGKMVHFLIYKIPAAAGLATFVYLPLVLSGMHHGLIAVNAQLISDFGVTYLLPVTCMAGMGQVGAAFYVLMKTKNARLKKTCKNALPIGILGIGEPLLWGVTVPLGRPFLASCLGGAVGGSVMALMKVAARVPELSGVQLSLICDSPVKYLIGVAVSWVAGFLICAALGFEDPEN